MMRTTTNDTIPWSATKVWKGTMKYTEIQSRDAIKLFLSGDTRLRVRHKGSMVPPFIPARSIQASCFADDSCYEFLVEPEPAKFTYDTEVMGETDGPRTLYRITTMLQKHGVKPGDQVRVTIEKIDQ